MDHLCTLGTLNRNCGKTLHYQFACVFGFWCRHGVGGQAAESPAAFGPKRPKDNGLWLH